jgi:hypothetical protein
MARHAQAHAVISRTIVPRDHRYVVERVQLDCGHERTRVIPRNLLPTYRPANWLSCRTCDRDRP